jgi:hypothetical protein
MRRLIMAKIMYARVKLTVKDSADTECIMGEAVYDFDHPDIMDTEWVECEEETPLTEQCTFDWTRKGCVDCQD